MEGCFLSTDLGTGRKKENVIESNCLRLSVSVSVPIDQSKRRRGDWELGGNERGGGGGFSPPFIHVVLGLLSIASILEALIFTDHTESVASGNNTMYIVQTVSAEVGYEMVPQQSCTSGYSHEENERTQQWQIREGWRCWLNQSIFHVYR